jgi:hypothetical protein
VKGLYHRLVSRGQVDRVVTATPPLLRLYGPAQFPELVVLLTIGRVKKSLRLNSGIRDDYVGVASAALISFIDPVLHGDVISGACQRKKLTKTFCRATMFKTRSVSRGWPPA